MSSKKGVYIDGHEHSDVVEYRIYLRRLQIISSCHAPQPVFEVEIPKCSLGPTIKMLYYSSMMRVFFTQMTIKAGCGEKR